MARVLRVCAACVGLQMLSVVTDGATVTHRFLAKEHRGVAQGQLHVDDQNIPPDDRETLRRSQGAESGAGNSWKWLL
jgi:hypothetical protein